MTKHTITDEQIRAAYEDAYHFDEHLAFACARALLPEAHPSFDAKLHDEARARVARHLAAEGAP